MDKPATSGTGAPDPNYSDDSGSGGFGDTAVFGGIKATEPVVHKVVVSSNGTDDLLNRIRAVSGSGEKQDDAVARLVASFRVPPTPTPANKPIAEGLAAPASSAPGPDSMPASQIGSAGKSSSSAGEGKPGSFTQLFGTFGGAATPSQSLPTSPFPSFAVAPAPADQLAPSPPMAEHKPGSFTRLFGTFGGAATAPPPALSAAPASQPAPPASGNKPGNFTQMFGTFGGSAAAKTSAPSPVPAPSPDTNSPVVGFVPAPSAPVVPDISAPPPMPNFGGMPQAGAILPLQPPAPDMHPGALPGGMPPPPKMPAPPPVPAVKPHQVGKLQQTLRLLLVAIIVLLVALLVEVIFLLKH